MVLDKDVLNQGFGEDISNLIISADRDNFDCPMMDAFTKMMIAYINMLCVRSEFGEPCKPALSSNPLQNT